MKRNDDDVIIWPEGYRVRPLDQLQWILERRDQKGRGGRLEPVAEVWRPYAYCRTRTGLETALSRLRASSGVRLDPQLIAHLPEFYEPLADRPRPHANQSCNGYV
jgi:hypothetical protein